MTLCVGATSRAFQPSATKRSAASAAGTQMPGLRSSARSPSRMSRRLACSLVSIFVLGHQPDVSVFEVRGSTDGCSAGRFLGYPAHLNLLGGTVKSGFQKALLGRPLL